MPKKRVPFRRGMELALESLDLHERMIKSDDLECVLVATGFLEFSLGSLLLAFLVSDSDTEGYLDDHKGGIGSFSSRWKLAYFTGLITKTELKNLEGIGKIRNDFAHHHGKLSFADERINGISKNLILPMVPYYDWAQSKGDRVYDYSNLTVRERFEIVAIGLVNEMCHRVNEVVPRACNYYSLFPQ